MAAKKSFIWLQLFGLYFLSACSRPDLTGHYVGQVLFKSGQRQSMELSLGETGDEILVGAWTAGSIPSVGEIRAHRNYFGISEFLFLIKNGSCVGEFKGSLRIDKAHLVASIDEDQIAYKKCGDPISSFDLTKKEEHAHKGLTFPDVLAFNNERLSLTRINARHFR